MLKFHFCLYNVRCKKLISEIIGSINFVSLLLPVKLFRTILLTNKEGKVCSYMYIKLIFGLLIIADKTKRARTIVKFHKRYITNNLLYYT